MDPDFLQTAARTVNNWDLSALLVRRANVADAKKKAETTAAAAGTAKPVPVTQRALSCPKCAVLWIPGLTTRVRLSHRASHNVRLIEEPRNIESSENKPDEAEKIRKDGSEARKSLTRNKNKRSRERARKRRESAVAKFEAKLKAKVGAEFVPNNLRPDPKFMHYACLSDNCDGSQIVSLRAPVKQERKQAAATHRLNQGAADPQIGARRGVSRAPKSSGLDSHRNDRDSDRSRKGPMGTRRPGEQVEKDPKKSKTGRLNLSDFML